MILDILKGRYNYRTHEILMMLHNKKEILHGTLHLRFRCCILTR